MPFCVLPLCVMPLCVLPFSVMPFSAFLVFLPFFTNFDSVYFRFDLPVTLFTFRLLNFVIDIPSNNRFRAVS